MPGNGENTWIHPGVARRWNECNLTDQHQPRRTDKSVRISGRIQPSKTPRSRPTRSGVSLYAWSEDGASPPSLRAEGRPAIVRLVTEVSARRQLSHPLG